MKALSLTQPMAWAIFHGKDIENRTWKTNFRGRVIIHASRKFDFGHYLWIRERSSYLNISLPELGSMDFVQGALIGEVDIIDCLTNHNSPWFFGKYGFVLNNPAYYKVPVPYRGSLGLFEVNGLVNKQELVIHHRHNIV